LRCGHYHFRLEGLNHTLSLNFDSPQLRFEGLAITFGFTTNVALAASSARGARRLIITLNSSSACRLVITFDCCYNYNVYVICADYFHYIQSLSHKHQPRGVGGVLEDKSILDDGVWSGAREIRLEDVASPSTMATSITSAFEARSTI
jgi:hypothetical protein